MKYGTVLDVAAFPDRDELLPAASSAQRRSVHTRPFSSPPSTNFPTSPGLLVYCASNQLHAPVMSSHYHSEYRRQRIRERSIGLFVLCSLLDSSLSPAPSWPITSSPIPICCSHRVG